MPNTYEIPSLRKLHGYAFDPSLSLVIDTVEINNIVYEIVWETDLEPGPKGEYVEVVDYDPTIREFFSPIDLNEPHLLARNGVKPSDRNPHFHQQMVYAVAMVTIKNFEQALGRKIIWAPRHLEGDGKLEEYVKRLRIYPHALRDANAYYSPTKKALLFGYFSTSHVDITRQMPGSLVFTCLSHDIIAHEVTHAILDGLQRFYSRPSNPDVLAFHEAFADIVALFQHFTFPDVLKQQIAETKGDLQKQNLLGQLARQLGMAIGRYGSLRDALGTVDSKTKEWIPAEPNPQDYQSEIEPHKRGSILVAAVFEAFLTIYKRRVRDLLRIASGGTGILQEGEMHPDLVNRLTKEAAKTAKHVLNMCIRAIDYCPPVDITFGDFLRAVITADSDLVIEDPYHYRLAFIEAFGGRGIYPDEIRTLSEESLRYHINLDDLGPNTEVAFKIITDYLREYRNAISYVTDRKEIFNISNEFITGKFLTDSRKSLEGLQGQLVRKLDNSPEFEALTGLVLEDEYGTRMSAGDAPYLFQIMNLRQLSRVGPDGNQINHIVFSLMQTIWVSLKEDKLKFEFPRRDQKPPPEFIEVQGGSTLIFDLQTKQIKYAISKPLFVSDERNGQQRTVNWDLIKRQYEYKDEVLPQSISQVSQYFGLGLEDELFEPFALLHAG